MISKDYVKHAGYECHKVLQEFKFFVKCLGLTVSK